MHLTGKPLRIVCAVILLYYFCLQIYTCFIYVDRLEPLAGLPLLILATHGTIRTNFKTNTILVNDGQAPWFGHNPENGQDD